MSLPASRVDAKKQNSKYFNTGVACRHGHFSDRLTSNGCCCACKLEDNRSPEGKRRLAEWSSSDRGRSLRSARKQTEAGRAAYLSSSLKYALSDRGREKSRIRHKLRLEQDPQYRLRHWLRGRLRDQLRRYGLPKAGSFVGDLGCTLSDLVNYIQSLPSWDGDWTWNDLGQLWQLDHILPLASFDLTDPEQFRRAAHYTNLQPLSVEDHKIKTRQDIRNILAERASNV